MTIKKIEIDNAGTADSIGIASVILEYKNQAGETKTASSFFSSDVATFEGLDMYVPANDSAYVTVKVNTGDVTTENTVSGDTVQLTFDSTSAGDFEAVGLGAGSTLDGADVGNVTSSNTHEIRKTKPTFSLASGSPSGASVPGLNEVFRFNVSADSRGTVTLDKVTFKLTASDNGSSSWEECDTNAADGVTIADATEWEIYNASDSSTKLDEGTTPWTFFDDTGAACTTTTADMSFLVVDFGASGGSISSEEIAGGETKTYILRFDSTGASSANDDTIRIEIPDQNEINSLSVGGGTALDDDAVVQWDDSNLTNSGALNIDGDYLKNLPITGGTIIY